jgi:hypothetical protein
MAAVSDVDDSTVNRDDGPAATVSDLSSQSAGGSGQTAFSTRMNRLAYDHHIAGRRPIVTGSG